MRVNVNGRDEEIPPGTTVADLIGRFNLQPRQVAVEINRDLVPRRTFAETSITEGDQIEIVTLVGGG